MPEGDARCPNGHSVDSTDRFCQTCGAAVLPPDVGSSAGSEEPLRCPNGHAVEASDKYCPTCRAPLVDVAAPVAPSNTREAVSSTPARTTQASSNRRRVVFVLVPLVVVIAAGAAAALVMRGNDSDTNNRSASQRLVRLSGACSRRRPSTGPRARTSWP